MSPADIGFERIIEPRGGPFSIQWRTAWQYRDLVRIFARLEYATKVKQTLLGPAWYVLHPLLTSLVFVSVFARVIGVPSDGVPPLLFYLCGLLAWNYFAQSLGGVAGFLHQHAHIFRKIYVPKLVFPVAVVTAKGIPFLIQTVFFAAIYGYCRTFTSWGDALRPSATLLLLPIVVLQIALLAMGVGLCLAALSVRFRDLQHVVGVVIQLWLYGTPVIFPLALVPERWRALAMLNPMAAPVELFRQAFFGVPARVPGLAVSWLVTLASVAAGVWLFHRVQPTLVDKL